MEASIRIVSALLLIKLVLTLKVMAGESEQPPQQQCEGPDLTLESEKGFLEMEVIAGLRVWQLAFMSAFAFLCLIIVLCCIFRCRIPRTKQEIEADCARKKVTKQFNQHLRRIPVEKLQLEKVLPEVIGLEHKRVLKGIKEEKLTFVQKIKKALFAKEEDDSLSGMGDDMEDAILGDETKGGDLEQVVTEPASPRTRHQQQLLSAIQKLNRIRMVQQQLQSFQKMKEEERGKERQEEIFSPPPSSSLPPDQSVPEEEKAAAESPSKKSQQQQQQSSKSSSRHPSKPGSKQEDDDDMQQGDKPTTPKKSKKKIGDESHQRSKSKSSRDKSTSQSRGESRGESREGSRGQSRDRSSKTDSLSEHHPKKSPGRSMQTTPEKTSDRKHEKKKSRTKTSPRKGEPATSSSHHAAEGHYEGAERSHSLETSLAQRDQGDSSGGSRGSRIAHHLAKQQTFPLLDSPRTPDTARRDLTYETFKQPPKGKHRDKSQLKVDTAKEIREKREKRMSRQVTLTEKDIEVISGRPSPTRRHRPSRPRHSPTHILPSQPPAPDTVSEATQYPSDAVLYEEIGEVCRRLSRGDSTRPTQPRSREGDVRRSRESAYEEERTKF